MCTWRTYRSNDDWWLRWKHRFTHSTARRLGSALTYDCRGNTYQISTLCDRHLVDIYSKIDPRIPKNRPQISDHVDSNIKACGRVRDHSYGQLPLDAQLSLTRCCCLSKLLKDSNGPIKRPPPPQPHPHEKHASIHTSTCPHSQPFQM